MPPPRAPVFCSQQLIVSSDLRAGVCIEPCFKVPTNEWPGFRDRMLSTGMAYLIPEFQISRKPDGKLLLSGIFVVDHEEHVDRLIVDQRAPSAGEKRFDWSNLPYGPALCILLSRLMISQQGVEMTCVIIFIV